MEKILRVVKEKSDIIQITTALPLIAGSLIPLLLLCYYTVPLADDFSYAAGISEASIKSLIPVILRDNIGIYMNWQGTYATILTSFFNFFAFFGGGAYPWSCAAAILSCYGAWLFAIRSILTNIFLCEKWSLVLWVYTPIVFYTANFLNQSETFYWLTGALVYTFPFCLLMIAIGIYARNICTVKKRNVVIALICLFWACGGTALLPAMSCAVFLFCSIRAFVLKRTCRRTTYFIFGCCFIFALLNILAPGNFIRQQSMQGGIIIGFDEAFFLSLEAAFLYYILFLKLFAFFSVLLLFPGKKIVEKALPQLTRFTGLWFIFVFPALFICIFPYVYGMGYSIMPPRYSTTLSFAVLGLSMFSTLLFCGWFWKIFTIKFKRKTEQFFIKRWFFVVLYILTLSGIGFQFVSQPYVSLSPTPEGFWQTAFILRDIRRGVVRDYKTQYESAFRYAAGSDETDISIVIPPDYPLFMSNQLSEDPNHWANMLFASYFGKNNVSVRVCFPSET